MLVHMEPLAFLVTQDHQANRVSLDVQVSYIITVDYIFSTYCPKNADYLWLSISSALLYLKDNNLVCDHKRLSFYLCELNLHF